MPYPIVEFVCQEPSSEYVMLATPAPKKINRNLPLSVQFSPPSQNKGQIPHSSGKESSQMAEVCPGGGGGELKFRVDRRISLSSSVPTRAILVEEGVQSHADYLCFNEAITLLDEIAICSSSLPPITLF